MVQPPRIDRRAATNPSRSRAVPGILGAILVRLLVAFVLVAGAGASTAQAAAPFGFAYLLANQPTPTTSPYTPVLAYQFNSTGAFNTVSRTGVGAYTARLPNLGARAGTVHVTAFGSLLAGNDASGPGACKVVSWGPEGTTQRIGVRCFDLAGRAVDGAFALTYVNLEASPRPMAYLWANSPTSPSYTPTRAYQFNATGATNTITRSGVGAYTARLPNLGAAAGHVQVTAYGSGSQRCQVANWNPSGTAELVSVRCFTSAGAPTDAQFTLTYLSGISLVGSACCSSGSGTPSAYVWANNPAAASYTPSASYRFNSTGATNTISRSGVGRYRVNFPGQALDRGTVQVTAYGAAEARCKVTSWTPSGGVQVRCFNGAGHARDTTFDATFLASTGLSQRIAVPSYFYPGPIWTKLNAGAPAVGLAIINPDSGPGAGTDPNYVAQTRQSQAAGLTVLGYVYTDYGDRPVADVVADIDAYYGRYGVDGIFFDEAYSEDCEKRNYYRELYNDVKARTGDGVVVINPGVRTQECYIATADIIVTFENVYAAYPAWQLPATAWERKYPATRFWHLIHATAAADMPNAVRLSKQRHAGWVYVTPDILPNPWDELPPDAYWNSLLARAGAL